MTREYCCTECGLIWFDNKPITSAVECPECKNTRGNLSKGIYACDTTGWAYMAENAVNDLKARGKKIHYHKEHPWHGKGE
jgi:hypothetical protein